MSMLQRIVQVTIGILLLVASLFMVLDPVHGYQLAVMILAAALAIAGVRYLVYYVTMARHMVGGRSILYMGILLADAGLFASQLDSVPQSYVMVYLIAGFVFAGVVKLIRALESKFLGSPSWKGSLLQAAAILIFAVICMMSMREQNIAAYLCAAGLAAAALQRIATVFQKTEIIYIP